MNKKLTVHSETVYIIANLLLSFSVAMITCTDFGVSMVVAPAYLISQKFPIFTFGQSEYILQGAMFIVFCAIMKRVKAVYFSSFFTCLVYGALLDMWRSIIPVFNPNITTAGSIALPFRIVFFVLGMLLTSLSIAMFFRTYLYPQVYDFFVKGVSGHFNIDRTKFKTGYDLSSLAVSVIMSLIMFGKFKGIGVGTVIMAVFNGSIIGLFGKLIDKYFIIVPYFKDFAEKFDI